MDLAAFLRVIDLEHEQIRGFMSRQMSTPSKQVLNKKYVMNEK